MLLFIKRLITAVSKIAAINNENVTKKGDLNFAEKALSLKIERESAKCKENLLIKNLFILFCLKLS